MNSNEVKYGHIFIHNYKAIINDIKLAQEEMDEHKETL